MTPFYMGGLAVFLLVVGIIILVIWFTRTNTASPQIGALVETPSATVTDAPTATATTPPPTATETATITLTPTITETPTPTGPFEYTVQEGDTCWDLAAKNNVEVDVLLVINSFNPGDCPIKPGDKIMIPLPDTQLPTETPIAATDKGTIEYYVKTGETLAIIASKFNTTVDSIKTLNKITDENTIQAGQLLKIQVNIVTPTPTKAATITNTPNGTVAASETPEPSVTATK